MRKRMCILGGALAVAGLAVSCGESGGQSGITSPTGVPVTMEYTASGNYLVVNYADSQNCYFYCGGTGTTPIADCSPSSDSMRYEISGNTLRLEEGTDNDTLTGSGAVIAYWMTFTRQGSGSGLVGMWDFSAVTYTVVSGSPTPAERAAQDSLVAEGVDELGDFDFQLDITNTEFRVYGGNNFADGFIVEWNSSSSSSLEDADSATYDITVTKVNSSTVRLTGKVTGEVVTITYAMLSNGASTTTFTSSDPTHAAHTYYSRPTTCPNDYEPTWYSDFLTANEKSTPFAKRTAPRSSMQSDLLKKTLRMVQRLDGATY